MGCWLAGSRGLVVDVTLLKYGDEIFFRDGSKADFLQLVEINSSTFKISFLKEGVQDSKFYSRKGNLRDSEERPLDIYAFQQKSINYDKETEWRAAKDPNPKEEPNKIKKGFWTDDLTRLAEAKKIRTVSGAKLRVRVEWPLINFKDFDYFDTYGSDGKVIFEGESHPLDIAQIWLRNE